MRDNARILPARKLTGARCRCSACGEYFNVVSTFDAHRVGGFYARRCLTSVEMTARGWLHNDAGLWIRCTKPAAAFTVTRISGDRHDPATQVRV